jgi:hypothetical protein
MNNKIWVKIFLLVCAGFLLSVCQLVTGSGDRVTETREVSNFDRVILEGSGEVVIVQSGEESLVIETDENVLQYVTSEVSGGTLILALESGNRGILSPELIFKVGVDDLVGARIEGSGDISAGNLDTNSLDVDISGSGKVKIDNLTAEQLATVIEGSGDAQLAGVVEQQTIDIAGSGKYNAGDLKSDSATVTIGGSGKAIVWAMETLNASIDGSGSVDYYGSPSVSSSESGSGSVNSKGEK